LGPELGLAVEQLALFGEDPGRLLAAAVDVLLLLGQMALYGLELALLVVEQLELLVEQVGPLLQTLLLVAECAACLLGLGVEGLPAAEGLFLRAEVGFLAERLGLAAGVGQDFGGDAPCRVRAKPGADGQGPRAAEDAEEQSEEQSEGRPVHVGASTL